MELMGDFLGALEEACGLLELSNGVLVSAELDHFMHELCVKEALLTRRGLCGAGFKRGNALLIDGLVVR
jgi:hypothetical protein